MSGGYPVLPRRYTGRGTDHTTANGLAALAGKRSSGIGAGFGPPKDLASTSGSRRGWIFPL
jgi:hypothetical protein